jgi:hypothetical protein
MHITRMYVLHTYLALISTTLTDAAFRFDCDCTISVHHSHLGFIYFGFRHEFYPTFRFRRWLPRLHIRIHT